MALPVDESVRSIRDAIREVDVAVAPQRQREPHGAAAGRARAAALAAPRHVHAPAEQGARVVRHYHARLFALHRYWGAEIYLLMDLILGCEIK